MTNEEIQKRIETAQARYKARLAPMLKKKEEDKKITEELNKENILLAYLDVDYCKYKTCSSGTVLMSTKISIATKEVESDIDGKTKFIIVYTILSEHDNFSKAIAREILNTRLKDSEAKQRITLYTTKKAVEKAEDMHNVIRKAIRLEFASNTDTIPVWLYEGIQLHDEIYGNDGRDLF